MSSVMRARVCGQGSAASGIDRLCRARVLRELQGLHGCALRLVEGAQALQFGDGAGAGANSTLRVPQATLTVHHSAFYRRTALNGSVGAAEAYMDGMWDCDDVVALVRMLVRNRARLDSMERGPARMGRALMRAWAALRRNTRSGSQRNIAAHYDLGNEFFRLFLDDNLMYSSALYAAEDESLELAQTRKLERICTKLELSPAVRVLEIGTGWGGFALHAARHHGCHVTTATISREQYELARSRVAAAGLSDRIEVLLCDYRALSGRYDRLVSIEMIEAVGARYLDSYFGRISELLCEDGAALIQAITIEDHRYQQALRSVDFIQRYIFPGSFIPSVSAMLASMARVTDLRLFNLEDIGASYALTLRAWRRRFRQRIAEVRQQGFTERFVRMWDFYLAYCEGGFIERATGDVQLLLLKPRSQRAQWVPALPCYQAI